MKTILIAEIQLAANRQRREFNLASLNELGESIKKHGLFHSIVLRSGPDGRFLVSGERRLRAISDIHALGEQFSFDNVPVPFGHIPYVDLGELDELAREEAELEENVRRIDLSWQERDMAITRLHSLRQRQAETRGSPPHSVAETAVETRGSAEGVHHEATRRSIIVARYLDDPEVRAAKSTDEAFKVLKRKEDVARRIALAAEVGRTYSAETAHTLLCEDARKWLSATDAEQFDIILTDPPYGIGADEFGDAGGHVPVGAHSYKDDYETWKDLTTVLAYKGFRVAKPQAHLYCFCDVTRFEELKAILTAAGWRCFRTPIVWHKPNGNRLPWVEEGPQRKYELILYANKGRKKVTRIYSDLVTYAQDENLGHQAQKPVALYLDLLRRSVTAGDRVLDPFAGSGPIFPAATELKLRATGIESDLATYAIAVRRLRALST